MCAVQNRKPPGGEVPEVDEECNRVLVKLRVGVERTVAHLKGWKGSSSVDSPHNSILLKVDMRSSPCCGGDVSGRVCRAE